MTNFFTAILHFQIYLPGTFQFTKIDISGII